MRVPLFFFITLLFCGFTSEPPVREFVEFKRVKITSVEHFTCDNLGNLYTANFKGDIIKYDKDGKQVATANFKTLGTIHVIDASNPFEILVFYKDQNKVIYFDNLLNMRGEVDFGGAGYFMLSAAARSYDNKLWIFDLNDLRLKKVKKDLSTELSSGNVREFSQEKNFAPSYIGDRNQSIYLFDTASGVYEFDNFGNYTRKIILTGANQLFVTLGNIYFLKDNKVYNLETELLREKALPIKEMPDSVSAFSISSDRLVLQSGNELILYTLKNKN